MSSSLKEVFLIRDTKVTNKATLGTCYVLNNNRCIFKSESLERAWVDNQIGISCLPEGVFDLELEYSHKFKKLLWEIKGAEPRTECKFHAANYWMQLNGCIALGQNRRHIDRDSIPDVTNSRYTMSLFHKAMEGATKAVLHIRNISNL